MTHIFVYGTLRQGGGADHLLPSPKAEFLGHATIKGTLHNLGGFPGLQEGDGDVIGDLFEIHDDSIMSSLDMYEGYREDDPENSLFVRKSICLDTIDGLETFADTPIWVYFFGHNPPEGTVIKSGDWFKR